MGKNIFLIVLLPVFVAFSININNFFQKNTTSNYVQKIDSENEKEKENSANNGGNEDIINDHYYSQQINYFALSNASKIRSNINYFCISNPLLEIITPPPEA